MRDRIAYASVPHLLDRRREESDLAGGEFSNLVHRGTEHAHPVDVIAGSGRHQPNMIALAKHSVEYSDENDDPQKLIVPAVHQQGFERSIQFALRRRQVADDRFQDIADADARLGRNFYGLTRVYPDDFLDLPAHGLGVRGWKVDLVQYRHQIMVRRDCLIRVGKRLRFDALRCVDDEQRSFDRPHGSRDLVCEIHVSRRVDQIEHVRIAVVRLVFDANRIGLDGDAPLPLDIHGIEELSLHIPCADGSGGLHQAVGQRAFSMVDMGDDGKIANSDGFRHSAAFAKIAGNRQTHADAFHAFWLGRFCALARLPGLAFRGSQWLPCQES